MKNNGRMKNKKGLTLVEMLVSLVIFAIASIFLISIFISAIVVNKKTLDNIVANSLFRMVNEYAVSSIDLDSDINEHNSVTEFFKPSTLSVGEESPKLSMQSKALKGYFDNLASSEINMDTFKMYRDHFFKIKLIDVNDSIEGQSVYTYVVALYNISDENTPMRSIQLRMHKKVLSAGP